MELIDGGRLAEPNDERAQQAEASASEQTTEDVTSWLRAQLADGPMPASAVIREGALKGYSEKQLRASREELHVRPYQEARAWHWQLPDPASLPVPEPDPEDEPPTDDEVRHLVERHAGEPWEALGWLDHDPEVEWIAPLRDRHRQALRDLAAAMRDVTRIRTRQEDGDKSYRARVVKALANGERPPRRSEDESDLIREAKLELAGDVVEERGEELAQTVLDALEAIRLRLVDVEGVTFGRSVGYGLERGPGAFQARRQRLLEAQLQVATSGGIEILSEHEPTEYQEVPS